jgi:RNA polymerase sigma-70 factor (ECF subfamily)
LGLGFWDPGPSADGDPHPDAEARMLESLQAELERLPSSDRTLIEAKYLQRRSTRELAEELGTTDKAVESRLARLREKLRSTVNSRLKHTENHEN